jgi:DNA-binding MarR family transcriptional regulator
MVAHSNASPSFDEAHMTATTPLEQSLTWRLHRVARLADRDVGAAYLAACGVGVSEGRCLAAIGSFAPLSLADLARAANQDKGHASRVAQALVDKGLVAKVESPDDARAVSLTLTAAGRRAFTRAMALIEHRNDEAFSALSVAERKTLGSLLDRVATSLQPGDEAMS